MRDCTLPIFSELFSLFWASLVAQMVKSLPTMRETPVRSLGQEDPLEKEMATHSSISFLSSLILHSLLTS